MAHRDKPCRFFMQGACTRGMQCDYSHNAQPAVGLGVFWLPFARAQTSV